MANFQELIAQSNGPRSLEGLNTNKVADDAVYYGVIGSLGCVASSVLYNAGRDIINKSVETFYRYAPYPDPYFDIEQTIVIDDQAHAVGNILVSSSVPVLAVSLFCIGMGLLKGSEVSTVRDLGKQLPSPNKVVSSDGVTSYEWDMLADRNLVPEDGIRFIWDGAESSHVEAIDEPLNGNEVSSTAGAYNGNGRWDAQRLERAEELANLLAKEQELKQATSEV